MAEVYDKIATALLELGFPGIVIIVLGFVAYRLFAINSDLHEKRVQDSRTAVEAITSNTATLQTAIELLRDRKRD